MMPFQIHRRWWFCLVLLIISTQSTWALTGASWTNLVSGDLTNSFKWNPVGTPTADNDVYITNYIGNSSIFLTNRQTIAGTGPTNGNLTVFNTGGTGVFTLLLSNSTYMVTNNTTIGANAVVQLGSSFISSASTFSNNNLYLAGNGAINFNAPNLASPSTLIVAGQFTNTTANAIASLNGSAAQLLFTANNIVTNQGALLFTALNAGSVGNTGLVLQVAGGANTFYNQGTVTLGAAATAASRAYVFSNQLINAGTFVLTNNAAATTNYFNVTGLAGSALTNAGLLKLFAGNATAQNVATLNSGGMVNTGTLLGEATAAAASSLISLADPAGVFSNAVGGWVVATNNGAFTVQAVSIVNQGTMLATNAATLNLAGIAGGTGLFKAGPGATLNFSSGGSLDFANSLSFAGGTVVVQGQFTNSQTGAYSSAGSLIITNGNLFNAASAGMVLGATAGGNGTLTINNAGSLYITNAAGNAQLLVGQNGIGTFTLNPGGTLVVNQLLVTNSVPGGPTNSFFNYNGGTLITSNAANQVAFNEYLAVNQQFNISGTWIAAGGSNLITAIPGGSFFGNGLAILLNAGASLIVTNGAQWYTTNFTRFTFNGAGVNVSVAGTGSALYANTSLNMSSANGLLTVANGGFFFATSTSLGGASPATNNLILVTGPGSVFSNYYFNGQGYDGFDISGGSGVIVSNGATLYHSMPINGGYMIGDLGSNNYTIVTGSGSVLNLANESLQLGLGVNGSTYNNYLTAANSGTVFSVGAILGRRGGQTAGIQSYSNTVTITDPGTRWISTGSIILGGESGNAGFTNNNYEQVIVTNGGFIQTVGIVLGNGEVVTNGASANDYNTFTVTGPGSTVTNTSTLVIGGLNSIGNTMLITNGAVYYGGGAITVGTGGVGSNNSLNILGGASPSTLTNLGLLTVGASGAGNNSVTATNAIITTSGLFLGNGSSNNSVTVSDNTAWNLLKGQLTFGNGTGNTLTVAADSTMTNVGGIGLLGNGLTFNLTNNVLMGAGVDVVTAQVSIVGGSLTLGAAGAGNNSLTISNLIYNPTGSSIIGNNSSSNTLTVLKNTVWNNGGLNITVGNGAAISNVLTINGGIMTNVATWTVGNGATSIGNSLNLTNDALLVSVGSANNVIFGGVSNNVFISTGSVLSNSSSLSFTGSGNTLTVGTNSTVYLTGRLSENGTGNRIMVTDPNALFVFSGNTGGLADVGGTGNSIVVSNGGTFLSTGSMGVGGESGSTNNYILVTGTGSLFKVNGGFSISYAQVAPANGSSNSLFVTSGGRAVFGNVSLGGAGNAGNSTNDLIMISNGGSATSSGLNMGSGGPSAGNVLHVSGTGSAWTTTGAISAGSGTLNSGNGVIIDNGGVVVAGSLTLDTNLGGSNDFLTINGGTLSNGALTVGTPNSESNTVLVNNGILITGATSIGGANSTNNAVILSGNSVWSINNNLITINAGSVSNSLTIGAGSILTNAGAITIGGAGSVGNQLIVGGTLSSSNITVGNAVGANSNLYEIAGGATPAAVSNGAVTIGGAGGGYNAMIVTNAGLWSNGLTIGGGSSNNTVSALSGTTWNLGGTNVTIGSLFAAGNALTIDAGVLSNVLTVTVGSGKAGSPTTNAVGNSLLITDSGTLVATGLRVGVVAGDNNNSALVLNGSLLQANSLTIPAGTTGNTISNRNATYQFTTATPTVTPNGFGSIAISSGTISFQGINNADVTANLGSGALSGISFAGSNTFTLNAASNINASAAQDYTFQAVPGNPSNYVNLVMVNGQTDYGNGNLTIGSTGSLLISNTTAGIDGDFQNSGITTVIVATANFNGNFVNQGTTTVINATGNFANTVANHGQLNLQNATLNTDAINYSKGTIHGNGTFSSDVNNLGTISPVSTLTFNGNLTLLGSSTVIMELTGYGNGVGTNDVINVAGNFQYAGTLTVTNTTGFTYAFGQEFYLFNFASGSQDGDFAVTNLPNLTPYGLAWNTSQLDTIGLLIVVPQPSSMLLLAAGVLLLGLLIHSKRRPCLNDGRHPKE